MKALKENKVRKEEERKRLKKAEEFRRRYGLKTALKNLRINALLKLKLRRIQSGAEIRGNRVLIKFFFKRFKSNITSIQSEKSRVSILDSFADLTYLRIKFNTFKINLKKIRRRRYNVNCNYVEGLRNYNMLRLCFFNWKVFKEREGKINELQFKRSVRVLGKWLKRVMEGRRGEKKLRRKAIMFNNGVMLLKGWCGWIAYVQLAQKSRVERGRKLREGFERWDCWVLRKKEEEERRERGERGWRRKCFIKGVEVWKEKVEIWREEREVERGRICRAEEWRENKLVRKVFSRLEAFRNERRELRDKTRIAEEVNYWKIIQKGFKALTLGVITSKRTNRRIELQSKAVKEEIFDTWKNIVVETKHKHDKVIARILKLRKLKVLETWKEVRNAPSRSERG